MSYLYKHSRTLQDKKENLIYITVKYLYLEVGGTSEKLRDIRVFEIPKFLVNSFLLVLWVHEYVHTNAQNLHAKQQLLV